MLGTHYLALLALQRQSLIKLDARAGG